MALGANRRYRAYSKQEIRVARCDEKSQVQALDRTQPGLPLKRGRAGTLTHDYKRHGTTTLFAALNTLDGSVIARCDNRHRHHEWLTWNGSPSCARLIGKPLRAKHCI